MTRDDGSHKATTAGRRRAAKNKRTKGVGRTGARFPTFHEEEPEESEATTAPPTSEPAQTTPPGPAPAPSPPSASTSSSPTPASPTSSSPARAPAHAAPTRGSSSHASRAQASPARVSRGSSQAARTQASPAQDSPAHVSSAYAPTHAPAHGSADQGAVTHPSADYASADQGAVAYGASDYSPSAHVSSAYASADHVPPGHALADQAWADPGAADPGLGAPASSEHVPAGHVSDDAGAQGGDHASSAEDDDGEVVGRTGARFGPYSVRKPKRAKEFDTGSTPVVDPAAETPPGEPTPEQSAERTMPLIKPWAGALVRPYAHTGGRTRSSQMLAIEALVSSSWRPGDTALVTHHRRMIVDLCAQPRSVAEVAALLSVPLGVARVVLGDLATEGVVVVHPTAGTSGDGEPDLAFMQRVLVGLRRL